MNCANFSSDNCNIACNFERMATMKKKDSTGAMGVRKGDARSGAFMQKSKDSSGIIRVRRESSSQQGRFPMKSNVSHFKFKDFCGTYVVTPEMVSRLTGAAPRTVAYWSAGKEPQRSSQQKLHELGRLFDALSDIIRAKSIGPWLTRSNPSFEGSTPLQVIERGEADRVWKMIWELGEGHSG
jgi:hypothetical protein